MCPGICFQVSDVQDLLSMTMTRRSWWPRKQEDTMRGWEIGGQVDLQEQGNVFVRSFGERDDDDGLSKHGRQS